MFMVLSAGQGSHGARPGKVQQKRQKKRIGIKGRTWVAGVKGL